MAKVFKALSTVTVGAGGAASIDFTAIPATYTDLVLICISEATPGPEIWMRVNGNTGTNYSRTLLSGNGTTAISNRTSNATKAFLNDGVTANLPSNQIVNIMNYSNTTTCKTIISRSNSTSDAAQTIVNTWRSTDAINSITILFDRASTFNAGSTFTLYGILKEA